ncbi:hypothetical protein ACP6NG_18060 [Brevibacterium casei]|uniref:hypothetical protein n=1 Tax=Brevibacterium TaxID=1696 RepID=UPI0010F75338|nr:MULTISPECIES: hypothetical protein [unclassified Brevibacterium]MCM1013522.1 hypothetical protein [Brevibacterium sp. XM4083]
MLQNGLDYELLEEETRDYVFYPAIHLLADSLPDNDDLMWAFLSLGESTTTRQAIQYVAISSSFVASGSGYHEKDDAAGKRDSELNLMRVSDIAEVEVKSIDGLELRGEYTSAGRPHVKVRDKSSIDVTLGSRRLGRKSVSKLIGDLVRLVGASS